MLPKNFNLELPIPQDEDMERTFVICSQICLCYARIVSGKSTVKLSLSEDEASITLKGDVVKELRGMANLV